VGTMTLPDFEDETRYALTGMDPSSPALTTARLDRWINQAYLWICMPNHYRHPELETTELIALAANTAKYAMTNTYYMLVYVAHVEETFASITDESRRRKLDPGDVREQADLLRTERMPGQYAWWENQIWLASVPDTASAVQGLEVCGYQQPTILSGVAATVLKPEWDEILVTAAEWKGWQRLNEPDRAYEARQTLGSLVNEVADIRRLHAEEWGWQTGANAPTYMRTT